MFTYDHVLSPQCLHFTAHLSFFLHLPRSGHPLLAPHRHPLYPSHPFHLPPPLLLPRRLSRPTELSIHYSICYLIVCAVWFVVYLNLSFLLDVVDRGGNKTAFGYFNLVFPSVLAVVFRYLGPRPYGRDGRYIDDRYDPTPFEWQSSRTLGSPLSRVRYECCTYVGILARQVEGKGES